MLLKVPFSNRFMCFKQTKKLKFGLYFQGMWLDSGMNTQGQIGMSGSPSTEKISWQVISETNIQQKKKLGERKPDCVTLLKSRHSFKAIGRDKKLLQQNRKENKNNAQTESFFLCWAL